MTLIRKHITEKQAMRDALRHIAKCADAQAYGEIENQRDTLLHIREVARDALEENERGAR